MSNPRYTGPMRLTPEQSQQIKREAAEVFGQPVDVVLFGSRVHDHQRGGDIDLLVRLSRSVSDPAFRAARLSARLNRRFNGRKVDVLVQGPSIRRLPIHEVAEQTGVQL